MRFQFSLQPILRLRQGLEHQQELLLQKVMQQMAAVQHAIESVTRDIAELDAHTAESLQQGLSASELHFRSASRAVWLRYREDLLREKQECQKLVDERTMQYRRARQEREILDSLRQNQLRIHRQNESRLEQRRVDELFLSRRRRV